MVAAWIAAGPVYEHHVHYRHDHPRILKLNADPQAPPNDQQQELCIWYSDVPNSQFLSLSVAIFQFHSPQEMLLQMFES